MDDRLMTLMTFWGWGSFIAIVIMLALTRR